MLPGAIFCITTRTVEQSREFDVNWCNREHILEPGASGTLSWTRDRDGEETASIRYACFHNEETNTEELILRYTITHTYLNREPRDLAYTVEIDRTPCNFGGTRPWFRCPVCTDRVGKLYRVPQHDKYICRDCGNLLYTSQTYSRPLVEAFERLDKAKERIHDGCISQEDLREFYDAKTSVFSTYDDSLKGLDDTFSEFGAGPNRANQYGFTDDFPPFEVWADRLFHRAIGAGIRSYGHYGRCTATAKTTSKQCGQPAIGDHGKCYYHGGAAGSGIGDGQTDHAAERITQLLDDAERERARRAEQTRTLIEEVSPND